MSTPRLTVLLTVFNGMPYMKEAVLSILDQSLQDFHFLIINNGSGDGTKEWLLHLDDPRITTIHLPRTLSRTDVLNKGLQMVQTEFTAIMDADDIALSGRLMQQMTFLLSHPHIALVGSDVEYIDSNGMVIGAEHFSSEHSTLCARLALYNQFSHAACMFRTKVALLVGGYPADTPYAQDLGLWIAMFKAGYKASSIPEVLTNIRIHQGQASRDLQLLQTREQDDYRLSMALLSIPGYPQASRQAARLRAAKALWKLKRKKEALAEGINAFQEAPLLLLINPILWQRFFVQIQRRFLSLRHT